MNDFSTFFYIIHCSDPYVHVFMLLCTYAHVNAYNPAAQAVKRGKEATVLQRIYQNSELVDGTSH